jgi:ferrochelatase
VQMACVNAHPQFLQMAADWANSHIASLLSEHAIAVNPQLAVAHTHHHHEHHDHEHHHH